MDNRILIRCDGGRRDGFGHLVRCSALADELKKRHGLSSVFALRRDDRGARFLREKGYPVERPAPDDGFEYRKWMVDAIDRSSAAVLVLDVRDEFPVSVLDDFRRRGVRVVAIDDPSDRKWKADLVFLPPVPQALRLNPARAVGEILVGWEWIPLRSEFGWRERIRRPCRVRDAPTVLVSMGGSDPHGLTRFAVESLNRVTGGFEAVILAGPGFEDRCVLRRVEESFGRMRLVSEVEDIVALMEDADLAVASFGMTAYELAALGVPSILISLTEDHLESASALEQLGAFESLGLAGDITPAHLAATVDRLLHSPKQRKRMSESGRQAIDGRGAARIADRIAGLL